jgi:phosphoribosylamine--glycine ligase
MEKIGVLVVSYGAREASMVDAFSRSKDYKVDIYVADKQLNPFNLERAAKHVVIPDLNIESICKFTEANREDIDFAIVGPEKPIIDGIRDLIEKRTKIPVICPIKDCAIEGSKIRQRQLFQEIAPQVNPRFRVFSSDEYRTVAELKKGVYGWLDDLHYQAVVKPDKPTLGKGVGVWGDHFTTREELFQHFLSNYEHGAVIIEEKIDGEESSYQAFSDGKHIVPLPDTRDYKRAFDDDKGPNTGGMGSYKNVYDTLPFLTANDRTRELDVTETIFNRWQIRTHDESALRGVPLYVAFMHTGKGLKILENNTRPGDPEIINILPLLKEDFVDTCFRMLEGTLTKVKMERAASVTTYKVPPNYGGYAESFQDLVDQSQIGEPVNLSEAYRLEEKYGDRIRIYPAAMEAREGKTYALRSRAVSVVGIGTDIQEARELSLEGCKAITGGALWYRNDIASEEHIRKSKEKIEALRQTA